MFTGRLSAVVQNETENGGASLLLWLGIAVVVLVLIYVLAKTVKAKAGAATKPGAKFRPSLTAEDVEGIRFRPPRLRERGYDVEQVSDLLDQTVLELRRLADENLRLQQQKADPLSQPVLVGSPVITPDQVVNRKFQTLKIRQGVSPAEVDDFLDRVVLGLRQWNAENAKLRSELSGNTLGNAS
nr:DivIVA domain-containing protein [Arthrobacter zhangbolii]